MHIQALTFTPSVSPLPKQNLNTSKTLASSSKPSNGTFQSLFTLPWLVTNYNFIQIPHVNVTLL